MNKNPTLIYLLLLVTLNFSCVEKKPSAKEVHAELANRSATDTLTFTSGIRAIFHDSQGNYWLGSHQEGACRFDGKSFEYFTAHEGLSDNQIRSIQEDQNGTIWLGTANGVSRYNGQEITNHTPIAMGVLPSEWKKTDDDLWFNAGNKAGVYRFDGQSVHYLAFPSPKNVNPDHVYFTTGLAEGKNGMLWMSTYAGVFGYDGSRFTIINDETLGLKKETGELHIRSILEDSKGRLWIGNNGMGVLLKDSGTTINFSESNNLIHPTSSRRGDPSPSGTLEHVFAIEEDGDGNIWFGDRDTGAWKYDGESMTNYTIDDQLTSPMIWDIYVDQNKKLLFAMAEGGVYQFNGTSFDKRF